MDTTRLLENLLLGGLLGVLGQGIRTLAGLKKLAESAATVSSGETSFDGRRLAVSLFLGFIAGALGVVTLMDDQARLILTKDVVLTLIGIGYAGVDFIESLLTKYVPKPVGPSAPVNETATANTRELTRPGTYIQVPRLPYSSK